MTMAVLEKRRRKKDLRKARDKFSCFEEQVIELFNDIKGVANRLDFQYSQEITPASESEGGTLNPTYTATISKDEDIVGIIICDRDGTHISLFDVQRHILDTIGMDLPRYARLEFKVEGTHVARDIKLNTEKEFNYAPKKHKISKKFRRKSRGPYTVSLDLSSICIHGDSYRNHNHEKVGEYIAMRLWDLSGRTKE